LCDVLRVAVEANPSIVLELDDAGEADLSFIQLVESARVAAAGAGGRLQLARPADGAVRTVLERGGFLDPAFPERTAFWTGTETCP
jgi:hypothetical protein